MIDDYNIEIIRARRKTVSIEIKNDLRVIVRAPLQMQDAEIQRFIGGKSAWLQKHLQAMEARQASRIPKLTEDAVRALAGEALEDLPKRVEKYAELLGVTVCRVTVRCQKTRWGSCSSKGNLNFNCLLMLCPAEVRDYVVAHELCHRIEMNHSPRFWEKVEYVVPDYKERRKWLKENEHIIMDRVR